MGIREDLARILDIAKKNNISEPFIVGGLPRDKVLGRDSDIQDVDLTTGDETIHELARLVSENFKQIKPDLKYKVLSDGHSQVDFGNFKFDFSSNYISPYVDNVLLKANIKNPTPMEKELFSRDFTCNTLIVDLNLNKVEDRTGMAIRDINKKTIKTPLHPSITLSDNTKRIVRIIYLAAKLGFEVEDDIKTWVRDNSNLAVLDSSEKYLSNKLKDSMQYDSNKTLKLINEMNLQNLIPYVRQNV